MNNEQTAVNTTEQSRPADKTKLPDIKPKTKIASLHRERYSGLEIEFPIETVSIAVGMNITFIKKVIGKKTKLTSQDVIELLDQDAYVETLIPRSRVIDYLLEKTASGAPDHQQMLPVTEHTLQQGHALDLLKRVPHGSVQCVVTSTPYWGTRMYDSPYLAHWADGEKAAYGHEQTPQSFLRHTTECLAALWDVLDETGSIWWNIMDSYNTRTQIRGSAVEALRAMQGKDRKTWMEQDCRRYSAGHSYLKDGEQCIIPAQIAERASRIGFYVKSVITWAKTGALPEPQESRVSRNLEYVIHLSKVRKPMFHKRIYRELPAKLGGRNNEWESDKLSDVWFLPTSNGGAGHGAQFPVALPARCIALSSNTGDLVLDPFVGAGNAAMAARALGRRFLGFDVSQKYLDTAEQMLSRLNATDQTEVSDQASERDLPKTLL